MVAGQRSSQRREKQQEELDRLTDLLYSGLRDAASSPAWKEFLQFASKFHSYSVRNCLLIYLQKPHATLVTGYKAWKTHHDRQVNKGEKGIRIFAPVTVKKPFHKQEGRFLDDEELKNTERSLVAWKRVMVGARPISVFDVSQTSGAELPERPRPQLLEGQAPEGLWDSMVSIAHDAGFRVEHRAITEKECASANGFTSFESKLIVVKDSLSDAAAAKTLAHELGHMMLHDPATAAGQEIDAFGRERGQSELEAESCAYLVMGAHGVDAGDYTFNYITGWADADPDRLLASADRIMGAANRILDVTQGAEEVTPETAERAAEVKREATQVRSALPDVQKRGAERVSLPEGLKPIDGLSPEETVWRNLQIRYRDALRGIENGEDARELVRNQAQFVHRLEKYAEHELNDGELAEALGAYRRTLVETVGRGQPDAPVWRDEEQKIVQSVGQRAAILSSDARLVRASSVESALSSVEKMSFVPSSAVEFYDRYKASATEWRERCEIRVGSDVVYDPHRVTDDIIATYQTAEERDTRMEAAARGVMTRELMRNIEARETGATGSASTLNGVSTEHVDAQMMTEPNVQSVTPGLDI